MRRAVGSVPVALSVLDVPDVGVMTFLHRSRRRTGSTAPRGGVPVASSPAAAAEKETTQLHGGYSNHE
ncbi:hypothetical protein GCM10010211_70790 [Streptomyces albospinus]|uniref:Uncharacterized protein n=1 Tax=Streptomyces albospinus TaxID=285515 RepID=A0ABQ2VLB1_9ACTN|nr:hypothetical protein GCM10010211_70790 [Streptomyces albospinus]